MEKNDRNKKKRLITPDHPEADYDKNKNIQEELDKAVKKRKKD